VAVELFEHRRGKGSSGGGGGSSSPPSPSGARCGRSKQRCVRVGAGGGVSGSEHAGGGEAVVANLWAAKQHRFNFTLGLGKFRAPPPI